MKQDSIRNCPRSLAHAKSSFSTWRVAVAATVAVTWRVAVGMLVAVGIAVCVALGAIVAVSVGLGVAVTTITCGLHAANTTANTKTMNILNLVFIPLPSQIVSTISLSCAPADNEHNKKATLIRWLFAC
jgi:hypothetical protein